MRKLVAAVLAGLTILTVGAGQAAACTRIVPRLPGESESQAWDRVERAGQDRLFAESASVFAADLASMVTTTRNNRRGLEATIIPYLTFKGPAPAKVIRYFFDGAGVACGDFDAPGFQSRGVFFADANGAVTGMIEVGRIADPALRAKFSDQIDQAPPLPAGKVEQLLNPHPFLHWFVIGGVSLLSLLIGYALGRMFRSPRKN